MLALLRLALLLEFGFSPVEAALRVPHITLYHCDARSVRGGRLYVVVNVLKTTPRLLICLLCLRPLCVRLRERLWRASPDRSLPPTCPPKIARRYDVSTLKRCVVNRKRANDVRLVDFPPRAAAR